jgi:hypothetical protein
MSDLKPILDCAYKRSPHCLDFRIEKGTSPGSALTVRLPRSAEFSAHRYLVDLNGGKGGTQPPAPLMPPLGKGCAF